MFPSQKDCSKNATTCIEQQFSRILRRWSLEPFGEFDDVSSNHQRLREVTSFLISHIFKQALDPLIQEFWCDGAEILVTHVSEQRFFLGGACKWSDSRCDAAWLAPYELWIDYASSDNDMPQSLELQLGNRDPATIISQQYPIGRRYRINAMAHSLYGSRPKSTNQWAVHISL